MKAYTINFNYQINRINLWLRPGLKPDPHRGANTANPLAYYPLSKQ